MKILVLGGSKNEKSLLGEKLAVNLSFSKPLYYIATMLAVDDEDKARIIAHQIQRKDKGFITIEQGINIQNVISLIPSACCILLDSLTAVFTNEMFGRDGINQNAGQKVCDEISAHINATSDIVLVSDYVFSDAREFDSLTLDFQKGLGMVHKTCASLCDVVLEVNFGNVMVHKGREHYEALL